MKKILSIIFALIFITTGLALSEEPVHFPDANLKQAVEDNLFVNNPTPSHMLLLVWFDGYEYNITDLTGLEYATNLIALDLADNKISNISALSGLINLSELYLENNEIIDISALSQLTNLNYVYLNNNHIRDISSLSELRELFELDLGYNQISDISGISGLRNLFFLDLSSNPLNDDAYSIHIPRLIENNPGIEIYYDPQTAARLIVSSANGGSVTRPGEGTFDYNYGDIVPVEATADHGYIFANWTGTAVDNGKVTNPDTASTTVTVDGNYTLQAKFLRSDGGVYFPDPNLQACVEQALGISNPTPTDMLLLTRLSSAELRDKIITDLTGLEYATNLVELDLYGNQIEELSALSELTELTILDLGYNEIEDVSPLAGLTKLTDLFLDDNQIWDISPLSGLTNLKGLDLSVNWIDSLSPLSNLKNLVWLGLEESEVYNISPLSGLNDLRELYLGWNYIDDVSALSGLTNLSVLDLSCNADDYSMGELDISPLSELTNLTYLNLEQNYIEDLSPLSGLTKLEYLNLRLTEAWDISPLSRLHNLEWLDLESNFVDDLSPLAGLAMLKHLNLKMNFLISDISALSQVPNLEWVDLSQNDVNDISALMNLSHLERVILWGNPLTDEACLHVQELIDRGVIVLCTCGVPVHTLTISSTSGGSVTEPGHGLFAQILRGTTMTIEATADPDYDFANWTGTAVDAGKVDDPYSPLTTIIVDGNYTLQANFEPSGESPGEPLCTWMVGKVPYYHQYVNDGAITEWCAQTCLKMLFHWWEDYKTLSEINIYFDIYEPYSQDDYMIKQWFSDVLSTANEAGYQVDYGYRSVWESIPVDTLKNHIIEGHPVIIPVGSGIKAEHFVVVVGYDETDDVFYLHDPDHYITQGKQNTNKGYDIAISSDSFLDYWDSLFYPGIPGAPAYCGWMVIKIDNATHSKTSFHTVDDARNERDINNAPDIINAPDVILSNSSPDN